MVFGWFRKKKSENFINKIERLQKITSTADKKLRIEHYEQLKKHLNQIKRSLPELVSLFRQELETIKEIPESPFKEKLTSFSHDLEQELINLTDWVNNACEAVEHILKIRVLEQSQEQKKVIKHVVDHIAEVLSNAKRDEAELKKLRATSNTTTSGSLLPPAVKVSITGTLNNGWRLADIQNVIIELGGHVKKASGNHPFHIVFAGERDIPLWESTPPDLLVIQVKERTGVDKKILQESFNKGKLVGS